MGKNRRENEKRQYCFRAMVFVIRLSSVVRHVSFCKLSVCSAYIGLVILWRKVEAQFGRKVSSRRDMGSLETLR